MRLEGKNTLFQYDVNQKFVDVSATHIDFVIDDEVYRVEVKNAECMIPDEFMKEAGKKTLYECYADGTYIERTFNVAPRPMPPDYIFIPTEKETFESLVGKVDKAVADLYYKAEAGEFNGKDGYTPVKGKDYFDGEKGDDGISPSAKIERTENGAKITITDAEGTTEAEIYDGQGGSGGDVTKAYVDAQDEALDQKFTGMYEGAEAHISGVSSGLTAFAQAQNKINESKVGLEDYATNTKAGIVQGSGYGINASSDHRLYCAEFTGDQYKTLTNLHAIGKGTLENVLNDRIGTIDELIGSGDL